MRNGGSPTRDGSSWRTYDGGPDHGSGPAIPKFDIDPEVPLEEMAALGRGGRARSATTTTSESEETSENDIGGSGGQALIIGNEMLNADPLTQDEMQVRHSKNKT